MNRETHRILTGIIGFPLTHTLSPAMHQAGFKACHLPFCYLPFSVPPEKLKEALRGLQALGARGINVTIPYKEKILPFVTKTTEAVEKTGALNTLLFKEKEIVAFNTDVYGFQKAVAPFLKRKKKLQIIILGAGGTCRAILQALSKWELEKITIVNRTENRAQKIKKQFSWLKVETFRVQNFSSPWKKEELLSCDMLVQTTPLGMYPNTKAAFPFPFSFLPPHCLVVDVIYNPPVTLFLKQAQKAKLPTVTGLSMLFWQGVRAFELFTEKRAPLQAMAEAIKYKL